MSPVEQKDHRSTACQYFAVNIDSELDIGLEHFKHFLYLSRRGSISNNMNHGTPVPELYLYNSLCLRDLVSW